MRNSSLFETLRQDHEKIADAFSRLAGSTKEEDRLRRVFDLQNILTPHLLAEDREVLPLIESYEGEIAPGQIGHEHDEIRGEMEKLSRTPVNEEEAFGSQVDLLYDFWKRHVEAEEKTLRIGLDRIAGERSDGLLQRYRTERDRHIRPGPEGGRNWM